MNVIEQSGMYKKVVLSCVDLKYYFLFYIIFPIMDHTIFKINLRSQELLYKTAPLLAAPKNWVTTKTGQMWTQRKQPRSIVWLIDGFTWRKWNSCNRAQLNLGWSFSKRSIALISDSQIAIQALNSEVFSSNLTN